jgi:putative selenium metabolism protein SsnA
MTEFLLGNGTLATSMGGSSAATPHISTSDALVWRDQRLVAVGPETELRQSYPKATYLDARGGMILPGLVNLHHHFYSALARGLDPRVEMKSFPEVLDRLWWRLDRALDAETIRLSAELSAADSIRWGATTVFDHHASPTAILGSLGTIAEVLEDAGLGAVLCYEISDRNGHDEALAGLDENLRFLRERDQDSRIRGVVGLHASFTLQDDTLEKVAELRREGDGCHIHLAEDPVDVEATREIFGIGPVQRLERFGLLDEHTLLAHGIHLGTASYESIAHHDATIIHNPESNANNSVGHLDTLATAAHGCRIGLGTDGMSSSMLRALRSAFLLHRESSRDPSSGFEVLPDLLANNVLVARRFFDEPLLGELVPGAPADVIVVDAAPPTAIDDKNFFGHLVFGAAEARVRHTIARGHILLKDFEHQTLDPEDIAARARERAPALWERFHTLDYGTSYLGRRNP